MGLRTGAREKYVLAIPGMSKLAYEALTGVILCTKYYLMIL